MFIYLYGFEGLNTVQRKGCRCQYITEGCDDFKASFVSLCVFQDYKVKGSLSAATRKTLERKKLA